jgi:hypothetical protein
VLFTKHCLGDHVRKNEKFRQAARTGERRDADRVLMGKPRGRDHLEEVSINGRLM